MFGEVGELSRNLLVHMIPLHLSKNQLLNLCSTNCYVKLDNDDLDLVIIQNDRSECIRSDPHIVLRKQTIIFSTAKFGDVWMTKARSHIKNTSNFIEILQNTTIRREDPLVIFDIVSTFTNILIPEAM